jgi:hypothetical protein
MARGSDRLSHSLAVWANVETCYSRRESESAHEAECEAGDDRTERAEIEFTSQGQWRSPEERPHVCQKPQGRSQSLAAIQTPYLAQSEGLGQYWPQAAAAAHHNAGNLRGGSGNAYR